MYTISKEADIQVQKDLDKIVEIIKRRIDPISIILFGGFGKGEGSFEIVDGKPKSLNDYDLYVITKNKIHNEYLEEVSLECSEAIGRGGQEFCENPHDKYDVDKFFHVDLRCIPIKRLGKLMPMQRTFELKRSPVICGEDIRALIPDVEVCSSDAIRLLFNKLHHLLLGEDNDKKIKIIYIYKAFLDCCAALLIIEKKFASRYKDRNEIFQKLDYPEELKNLVAWATDFRNQPDFDLDNINKRFLEAKKWVLWALKKIVLSMLNLQDDGWETISKAMYVKLPYNYFAPYLSINFFPAQYALNLFYVKRAWNKKRKIIRPLFSWRDAGLILGISMILYNADEYGLSRMYLNKVEKEIKDLKIQLLELYGLYYSQRCI